MAQAQVDKAKFLYFDSSAKFEAKRTTIDASNKQSIAFIEETNSIYANSHLFKSENPDNKTTELSALSTDAQYPSAKCVYDTIAESEEVMAAAVNDLNVKKIAEPAVDGSAGQVLATDGNGGRSWITVSGSGSYPPEGGIPISHLDSSLQRSINCIPAVADPSTNQLADRNFVNSSIATSTSTFRGTVTATDDSEAAAQTALATIATTPDDNDYANVVVNNTPQTGVNKYKRYTYTRVNDSSIVWMFNYAINTSGFTSDQWATINSGLASTDKTSINTLTQQMPYKANDVSVGASIEYLTASETLQLKNSAGTVISYTTIHSSSGSWRPISDSYKNQTDSSTSLSIKGSSDFYSEIMGIIGDVETILATI